MSLFQTSVLKKNLEKQDKTIVEKAYKKFKKYFFDVERQQNIRLIKEEGFQQKFLMELFVNVFDYIINPDPNFNLTTEFKNLSGAKKADGAILVNGKALAVIELKSTKVGDLEQIRQQAFDYKSHHPTCKYVITSTFDRLRFYIENSVDFEEFDLFNITAERFELFYLCLAKENLTGNIPLQAKEESVIQEDKVTKQLYADYSLFKREIFRDIVKRNYKNPELRELTEKDIKKTLFKKTQKLLDRFLFVFFGEDRGLLPPNSISQIIDKWKDDVDFGSDIKLYDIYKQYFHVLDIGRPKSGTRQEIFAYNGGLFKPDAVLNSLIIDNDLLLKHTAKLTKYDFETDVDVNILGHIFENSLNEIESINAEIEGVEFDKQKTKRKKDGVFYTPKYITKYIVDNTIGKLCDEKKKELEINEEVYLYAKQRSKKRIDNLDEYRAWLLQLTICDPACGSGAFLNQALDFLIREHAYIDQLTAKYHNVPMVLSDIENSILENNIFGVDINEESVEIAKLSLWLRTAQKGRKLTSLSSNIKCGNSLIDSKEVAGDKAFNWKTEFKNVFDKGGFDVVIGNPPYVRQELFKEIKPYLEQNYKCYNSIADLYTYFIEKGINLIYTKGLFSFILPNKFLKATYGKEIRKVIKEDSNIELIFDFDDYPVFEEATTYPIIYILNKNEIKSKEFIYSEINKRDNTKDPIGILEQKKHIVSNSSLTDTSWDFSNIKVSTLLKKINSNSNLLKEVVDDKIFRGVSTGCNEAFIVSEDIKNKVASSGVLRKIFMGKEVKRYKAEFQNLYLLFLDWEYDIDSNESIKEYLNSNRTILEKRPEVKQGRFNWWCLSRYGSKNSHLLSQPKIIYPRINNKCNFFLDETGEYSVSDNNFFISTGSKALLAFLNSSVTFFFLKNTCTTLQGGYWDFRRPSIEKTPVHKDLTKIDKELSELAEKQLNNNNFEIQIKNKFNKYIHSQFNIEKLSNKLQNWHELKFADFINELNKAIKTVGGKQLSKSDEFEWMELFENKKTEAQALKSEIDKTDKEIDQMVYELYGLSAEEIKIVEEGV